MTQLDSSWLVTYADLDTNDLTAVTAATAHEAAEKWLASADLPLAQAGDLIGIRVTPTHDVAWQEFVLKARRTGGEREVLGRLQDYRTGEDLRQATHAEEAESIAEDHANGGFGVIMVEGRACFVS